MADILTGNIDVFELCEGQWRAELAWSMPLKATTREGALKALRAVLVAALADVDEAMGKGE